METNQDVATEIGPGEARAIDEVTARLIAQYPQVPAEDVLAIVDAAWAQFSGRPIRHFVPVLVERTAREKLAGPIHPQDRSD